MMRHRFLAIALVAATIGLGGRLSARSSPAISSISPSAPARSGRPQTITVSGSDFRRGLSVSVTAPGGNALVFQGDEVRAQTAQSFQLELLVDTTGTYSFVVTNPDGGASAPFALEIREAAQGPQIDAVSPEEVVHQRDPHVLRVEGRRFEDGLTALVVDPAGANVTGTSVAKVTPTSFELTSRLDTAGDYRLSVTNPAGATSNAVTLRVR